MTTGLKLAPIPDPVPEGKRQLRCPVPGCNHRFLNANKYRLHWRVNHDPHIGRRSTR